MDSISVAVMLARMELTYEHEKPVVFEITFIKADGSLRTMKAQNHVKHAAIIDRPGTKSRFKYNLKEKGTVLLYDVEEKQYRSVRIDRIVSFNRFNVQH